MEKTNTQKTKWCRFLSNFFFFPFCFLRGIYASRLQNMKFIAVITPIIETSIRKSASESYSLNSLSWLETLRHTSTSVSNSETSESVNAELHLRYVKMTLLLVHKNKKFSHQFRIHNRFPGSKQHSEGIVLKKISVRPKLFYLIRAGRTVRFDKKTNNKTINL